MGRILGLEQKQMLHLWQRGVSVLESVHLSLLRNITSILLYNISSLNLNLSSYSVFSLGCVCVFLCFILFRVLVWSWLLVFTFMVSSIFISHLREKLFLAVLLSLPVFLSAAFFQSVKTVGFQGWNFQTKICFQMKILGRINKIFTITSIHKLCHLNVCS